MGPKAIRLNELHWYALQVRPQCEMRVRDILRDRQICESFLPSYFQERKWSDRKVKLEVPFFRGYAFARFLLPERRRVLELTQVVNILGDNHKPIPIPDTEIQSLRTLVMSPLRLAAWPRPAVGQSVYLEKGPLRGAYGVVVSDDTGKDKLVLEVKMLGRGIQTAYRPEWARPLGNAGVTPGKCRGNAGVLAA